MILKGEQVNFGIDVTLATQVGCAETITRQRTSLLIIVFSPFAGQPCVIKTAVYQYKKPWTRQLLLSYTPA